MNEKLIDYITKHMPSLNTERLLLRKIKLGDASDMFEYSSVNSVTRYLTWETHSDLKYTKKYLKYLVSKYKTGEYFDWGIILKSENKLIGTCGFTAIDITNSKGEIGYVLNPEYHNNGYGLEAVKAVIDYAFNTLELNRVEARVMEGNTPSMALLEKCGMIKEGMGRKEMYIKGEYKNILHYSILKEETV